MQIKGSLFLMIITLTVPYISVAKNYGREYEKMIKMYDVAQSAKDAESAQQFWWETMSKNERFAITHKTVSKKSSVAKAAAKNMQKAKSFSDTYAENLYYVSYFNDRLEYLKNNLGNIGEIKLYSVFESGEINAFTYPDGRIYFETAMLNNPNITDEMLLGICAHEYAHFLLFHSLAQNIKVVKRKRRNNILAGITSALMVASATYAAANGVSNDHLGEDIVNLFESAKIDSYKFRYKYSREQEIEADIIAYRFLELIGIGGDEYIKALEYLAKISPDNYSENSDHPSTSYRIGLLKYMKEHPEIKRIPPRYILNETGEKVISVR